MKNVLAGFVLGLVFSGSIAVAAITQDSIYSKLTDLEQKIDHINSSVNHLFGKCSN